MLEIGKTYTQVGGRVKINHALALRTNAYRYSKEDGCYSVSPGFSFGCTTGVFRGKAPGGFFEFDLPGGKKCLMNGGNFEVIDEKGEKNAKPTT